MNTIKKFEVIWVSEDAKGVIYSGKEIVEARNNIEAERKVRLSSKDGMNKFPTGTKRIGGIENEKVKNVP